MDEKCEKYIEEFKEKRNLENKLEKRWLNMFMELLDFRDEHGHVNVPAKYKKFKSLGYWVRRQRLCYHQGKLDPLREELFRHIGFNFRLLEIHDWDVMLDKLVQFSKQYGHVHITESYEDRQLHNWLVYQRKLYWKGKLGKQKLEKLKALGVDMQNKTLNRWENKYARLVEFKKKHRHLHVCRHFTDDLELINFVKVIRRDRDKISVGRREKLDKIGFDWNPGRKVTVMLNRERAHEMWMQHFRELKAFKENHGNCRIPFNSDTYTTLYGWVSKQRNSLDRLPKDKIRLLEEIGVSWN